jgi:preprotein translocase subunit SecY
LFEQFQFRETFRNIFSIPDLRRRLFFTFVLLAVYRVGAHIPLPGVDAHALKEFFEQFGSSSLLGYVDMFTGGAFQRLSVFALNIMPYISASIILQLLTVVSPYLEQLRKSGEAGQKKITQYTRYGTVLICLIQSMGIAFWTESLQVPGGASVVSHAGWGFRLTTVITLTAGTVFLMWIGEQISESGIGNGISLIIFAGIVVRLPQAITSTVQSLRSGTLSPVTVIGLAAFMILVCAFVVYVERGQRRIPIQYAKRMVGRRMMMGQATHLPMRVNVSGVIPVIFAISLIVIPQTVANFEMFRDVGFITAVAEQLHVGRPLYMLTYMLLIFFFCFLYTSIIFNPDDVSENLKKHGAFIPGIRPGRHTSEYISTVLNHLTFAGAVYLAAVAILPDFLTSGFQVQFIPGIGPWLANLLGDAITQGFGVNFYFGGTSLLIVISVAMDFIQQVEAQLVMRHYDGFLKGTRIKGRRG